MSEYREAQEILSQWSEAIEQLTATIVSSFVPVWLGFCEQLQAIYDSVIEIKRQSLYAKLKKWMPDKLARWIIWRIPGRWIFRMAVNDESSEYSTCFDD